MWTCACAFLRAHASSTTHPPHKNVCLIKLRPRCRGERILLPHTVPTPLCARHDQGSEDAIVQPPHYHYLEVSSISLCHYSSLSLSRSLPLSLSLSLPPSLSLLHNSKQPNNMQKLRTTASGQERGHPPPLRQQSRPLVLRCHATAPQQSLAPRFRQTKH
jgi:hypothetical protein